MSVGADQTMQSRRTAREQEQMTGQIASHVASLMSLSVIAWQPMLQFQCAIYRSAADGIEEMTKSLTDNTRNLAA